MVDFVWLGGAAFRTGLVDAVVGGGGLIQVSAISSFLPKEAPASPVAADVVRSLVAFIVLLCFTWNKAGAVQAVRLFYARIGSQTDRLFHVKHPSDAGPLCST